MLVIDPFYLRPEYMTLLIHGFFAVYIIIVLFAEYFLTMQSIIEIVEKKVLITHCSIDLPKKSFEVTQQRNKYCFMYQLTFQSKGK